VNGCTARMRFILQFHNMMNVHGLAAVFLAVAVVPMVAVTRVVCDCRRFERQQVVTLCRCQTIRSGDVTLWVLNSA
jgi:hypothetical protein